MGLRRRPSALTVLAIVGLLALPTSLASEAPPITHRVSLHEPPLGASGTFAEVQAAGPLLLQPPPTAGRDVQRSGGTLPGAQPYVSGRDTPPSGVATTLVLLVEFNDTVHQPQNGNGTYEDLYFNSSPDARSVDSYYQEASFGALEFAGAVVAWAPLNVSVTAYAADGPCPWQPQSNCPDAANGPIYRLAADAARAADPLVDFGAFDTDDDGMVDNLVVIHAGGDQAKVGGANDTLIWSHHWAILDGNATENGSQSLTLDGVQLQEYSMVAEDSPVGVNVHEFGHQLGMIDLYDRDCCSRGAGLWEVMAGGAWLDGGNTPAHPSAFVREELGWVTPTVVTQGGVDVPLRAIETSGEVLKLPIDQPTDPQEYFLLEVRNTTLTLFDSRLPGSGLLIWHVDRRKANNDDDEHRRLDLEEADEAQTGDRPVHGTDPWKDNDAGFHATSVPAALGYDGQWSGWTVNRIGPDNATMTFQIATLANDVGIVGLKGPRFLDIDEPAAFEVDLANFGSAMAVDVQANVTLVHGSTIVAAANVSLTTFASGTTWGVPLTFLGGPVGSYLLRATVVASPDNRPTNDLYEEVIVVTQVLWADDMESGVGQWEASVEGVGVGGQQQSLWHLSGSAAYSPVTSWMGGPEGNQLYEPGSTHLLTTPLVDIGTRTQAYLLFRQRFDLDLGLDNVSLPQDRSDSGRVEVSLDGAPYQSLMTISGTQDAWSLQRLDLGQLLETLLPRAHSVQVRFVLEPTRLQVGSGWWVDDIALAAGVIDYDVIAVGPLAPLQTGPAETIGANLTLWNTGTRLDSYDLLLGVPLGWEGDIGPSATLQPGERTTVALLVTPPAGLLAGTLGEVTLQVASRAVPSLVVELRVQVEILPRPALHIVPVTRPTVVPGQEGSIIVTVVNPGNVVDPLTLTLTPLPPASAGMLRLEQTALLVPALGNATLAVDVVLPLALPEGTVVRGNLSLTSTVLGTMSVEVGALCGHRQQLQVALSALDPQGARIDPTREQAVATPAQPWPLVVEATNLGNGPEQVRLVVEGPAGWDVQLDGDALLSIAANTSTSVEVELIPPLQGLAGRYPVHLRLLPASGGSALWDAQLVVELGLADLRIDEVRVASDRIAAGTPVALEVLVTNGGAANATGIVVAIFDGTQEAGRYSLDPLAPSRTGNLSVLLELAAGDHELTVSVQSTTSEAHSADNSKVVHVRVIPPPLLIGGMTIAQLQLLLGGTALLLVIIVGAAMALLAMRRRGTTTGRAPARQVVTRGDDDE